MKIAVLFSGLIPDKAPIEENVKSVHAAFPTADFYFGSWDVPENDDKAFLDVKFEPIKHHYNCYYPVIKHAIKNIKEAKAKGEEPKKSDLNLANLKNRKKFRNNINQVLIHTLMYEKYVQNSDYDIVVRARYETFIDPNNADKFDYFVKKCYVDFKPIGFETIDLEYEEMPCGWNTFCQEMPCTSSFSDWLIIHRKDRFYPDRVWDMYRKKLIRYAEAAWWDIIFKASNFTDVTDCCWNGFVDLRRELGDHVWIK